MASSVFVGLGGPTSQIQSLLIVDTVGVVPISIHTPFANGIDAYTHSDTAFRAPAFNMNRSKGTQAAPTAVGSGYHLAYVNFLGYDGTDYLTSAYWQIKATEDWSASAHGASIELYTTPNASATPAQRLMVLANGNIGVHGVNAPTAFLHLNGGSATAGTAPLKFTSGTVLATPEAGATEFVTDTLSLVITTGTARKGFVLDDGSRLTSGKIPIASTNGRLIDGQTPLAGTKTYWVSDSSGGAVNRKLTFIAGILTAET